MLDVPALVVLTATRRGMEMGDMTPAAKQAFGELTRAVQGAGLLPRALSWLSLFPDEPQGIDDQQARMLRGIVFDRSLAQRQGTAVQLPIALSTIRASLWPTSGAPTSTFRCSEPATPSPCPCIATSEHLI